MTKKKLTKLSQLPVAKNPLRNIKIDPLFITAFMGTKYKRYALYSVAKRAVPSLVDGFKTGARKVLHAALSGSAKHGKDIKSLNLVGDIFSLSGYDHGDASLFNTILTLSSDYTDNLAPIFIKGQGGSLRSNTAAAARYLYIRLSKYTNLLYKKDYDILKFVESEGSVLEPVHYLPVIPTVLCANTSGIGVGYAFSSFSYNPIDIIHSIRNFIAYGTVSKVRPYVKGLGSDARWFYDNERWQSQGFYEIIPATKKSEPNKIIVSEWPFDKTFESMEEHYNDLIDKEIIKDWVNRSRGTNLHYELVFKDNNQFTAAISNIQNLELNILKNISKVDKNNLTVIDENGKITYFETPEELIAYFTKFRLSKYNDRKKLMIDKINARIIRINMLLKFIQLVIDGTIILSNRAIKLVKADLTTHKIDFDVLQMPISRITKEEFEKLKQELKDIKKELEYLKKTSIEEMYLNDLDELEKALKPDFLDQEEIKLNIETFKAESKY